MKGPLSREHRKLHAHFACRSPATQEDDPRSTLTKEDGPADLDGVTHLSIGVSWDPTAGSSGGVMGVLRRKTGTDLDLIAIAMQGMDPVRLAGLDWLDPMGNGSLVRRGDNQTGRGEGDDETLTVEFAAYRPTSRRSCSSPPPSRRAAPSRRPATSASRCTTRPAAPLSRSPTSGRACSPRTEQVRRGRKAVRVDGSWKLEVINVTGKMKQGDEHALDALRRQQVVRHQYVGCRTRGPTGPGYYVRSSC